jgi:hypothetical protein
MWRIADGGGTEQPNAGILISELTLPTPFSHSHEKHRNDWCQARNRPSPANHLLRMG